MKRVLLALMLAMGAAAVVAWSTPQAAAPGAEKKCCRGDCDCQLKDGCCPDTHCQENGRCV